MLLSIFPKKKYIGLLQNLAITQILLNSDSRITYIQRLGTYLACINSKVPYSYTVVKRTRHKTIVDW